MKFSFITPGRLKALGVMGMNQRNADFVMKYNPRHLYPLVDNKLLTKKLAISHGINVPELYTVFRSESDLKNLTEMIKAYPSSVIKPAHGSGGNGILVLDGMLSHYVKKASGDIVTVEYIKHHISNIMSGMYSLGGTSDQAILEYRVQFDPFFSNITYKGVPDIRVIVFRGIPVASMIRLPTCQSDGKANLHQGAVGVGIDLESGQTTFGVHKNKACTVHPDTLADINGILIPNWNEIIELAFKCADTVQLGYLGVDIVLDSNLGPLVLELNARPGLNVQLANKQGLSHRLAMIKDIKQIPSCFDERRSIITKVCNV